jgi:hypothetical protein
LKLPAFLGKKYLMSRPKGSKNKRTLLREAEEALGRARDPNEIVDMLHVIEKAASHFYLRAEMGKNAGRKQSEVDEDYRQAAHLAALAAPYRHARLSAMKLAGDPNNPVRFKDDATAEELRAEMMRRIAAMADAGIIDLAALPAPNGGTGNRPPRGADPSGLNGG